MNKNLRSFFYRHPLYLLFLPGYAVLQVINEYAQLLEPRFVWKEWVLLFVLPLLIVGLLSWRLRSGYKGALLGTVACLLFFFAAPFKEWLNRQPVGFLHSFIFWGLLLLLLFGLLYRAVARDRFRATALLPFTNALSGVYLLIELFRFFLFDPASNYLSDQPRERSFPAFDRAAAPDIYHLVFDEYASGAQLQRMGFDNSALYRHLEERGFFVADSSRSNYRSTLLSMSSVFNMQYHGKLDTARPLEYTDYLRGQYTLERNELMPLLRRQGYALFNYTNYNFEQAPPLVPRYDYWSQRGLYRRHNLLAYMHHELGWHLPPALRFRWGTSDEEHLRWRQEHLQRLVAGIDSLAGQPAETPRFVYAHFPVPHAPYAYDSLGRLHPRPVRNRAEEVSGYLDQVRYTNRVIKRLTDRLLAAQRPGRPLVILLQSDHGLRPVYRQNDLPSFHNMSAIYFSTKDYRLLRKDMTLVNTYPIVLNTFFGAKLPLLPDRTFLY